MKKQEQFVEKSTKIHGNKYGYDLTNYTNAITPVTIICPHHGPFTQKPRDHVQGCGCPVCGGRLRHTKDTFIRAAIQVHGTVYDYSLVQYRNNATSVTIGCPIHGTFDQTPNSHLSGRGCPKCGGTHPLTTDVFVQTAREIHGDKYNYANVNYVNIDTSVIIECPIHGMFEQTPNNHLHGKYGCPACGHSRKDGKYNTKYFTKFPDRRDWPAQLYVIRFSNDDETFIKVGITIQDTIRHRFRMSIYNGYMLEVLCVYKSSLFGCWEKEQEILTTHANHKHNPQQCVNNWYGKHECLSDAASPTIVQFLKLSVDSNATFQDNSYILIDRRYK